jgi:glycosyltransferase involved in cell wall biosynthesis
MQVVHALGRGGSEGLARDIALGVDRDRVKSSVCALDEAGPLADELQHGRVRVHVMGRGSGLDWRLMIRLLGLFRRERVKVVLTHHLNQLLYAGMAARLARATLIHVEHEHFSLIRPRNRRLLKLLAPLCHRVVVVGEGVAEYLRHQLRIVSPRLMVIPNGVDLQRFSPVTQASRELLGLPRQGRLVGTVARLEPVKDHATLLVAFRELCEREPEAWLILVGEGSLRQALEMRARELGIAARVTFLGARADVPDLLPHLEVFVLSSVNEGVPLAILEAMACARPVVATAVGGVASIVRDQLTGLTVPRADPEALSAAVLALFRKPHWARDLGRRGREIASEEYSLSRTVERYQALCLALAQ